MSRTAEARICTPPVPTAAGGRPVSLLRARRTHELFLRWHIAFSLLLESRARLDPISTLELMLDIGGWVLTDGERADLLRDLRIELAEPRKPETTAMLDAAARWFCRLRLRGNEEELILGPPPLAPRPSEDCKNEPDGRTV